MPRQATAQDSTWVDWWVNAVDESVLVLVPAGEFVMGTDTRYLDERPRRRVRLDAYWIGKYPVTNAQFRGFVRATGYREPDYWDDRFLNGPDQPVVGVSWDDAKAYCKWAGLTLPTEAQWEKAARGSDGRSWPWGNANPTEERCNFDSNVGRTTKVGNHPGGASPYGCMNMAGNVWEWCRDWYGPYSAQPKRNPTGPWKGEYRVLRGGSWHNHASHCRSGARARAVPDGRDAAVGFRISMPLP